MKIDMNQQNKLTSYYGYQLKQLQIMLTTFQWHFSEMAFCTVPFFLGRLGLKWSCGLSQAPGKLAEGKLG